MPQGRPKDIKTEKTNVSDKGWKTLESRVYRISVLAHAFSPGFKDSWESRVTGLFEALGKDGYCQLRALWCSLSFEKCGLLKTVFQLWAFLVEFTAGAWVGQIPSLLMWSLHRGGPPEAVYWHPPACLQRTLFVLLALVEMDSTALPLLSKLSATSAVQGRPSEHIASKLLAENGWEWKCGMCAPFWEAFVLALWD